MKNQISMHTQNTPLFFERFNKWLRESVSIKLASIGLLVLILLIPTVWIYTLIEERQQRAEGVMAEVSDKWSGAQTVTGPVLVLPYLENETFLNAQGKTETRQVKNHAYILPEELVMNASVKPKHLYRGIFDVVVYESDISVSASFLQPDFNSLQIEPSQLLWKEAQLAVGISDLRGISGDPPVIRIGSEQLAGEPSQDIPFHPVSSKIDMTGMRVPLNWQDKSSFRGEVNISISLKGSRNLYFVPSARTTHVHLKGNWNSPSFDGAFLPYSREVSDTAFSATWKVLHYNRPIPQQWVNEKQTTSNSHFGVTLLVPADQYQKSLRTAKYAVLIILFTFVSLFFTEIIRGIRIHPFQYILIGAALIIYYTLLLSLSEQIGFNRAYWLASAATITLITAYASTFLQSRKDNYLLCGLLILFYTFIFIITLLEDYALLTGSVGLFLIIAALMYTSRKINWYKS